MTENQRYSEVQKTYANFWNGVAIGSVVVGLFSSASAGSLVSALIFALAAIISLNMALAATREMKLDD